jgi:HK97 family phage portal protein
VGWLERIGLSRRSAESQLVEYNPEEGLSLESWNRLPDELRAVLPWNVYGSDEYGNKSNSGAFVNEENAFKFGVVYAAITLIADGVASLPPQAFTLGDDGTRTAQAIPQWIRKPHPEIRRFDVYAQILVSALTWGDGFAQFIRRPSDGVIIGLLPLAPDTVTAEWDPNKPGYRRYKIENNGPWLTSADIFHVQGPTLPGEATGMSVIRYAREAIGLGLTLEEYGARYFGQGSQAKIVLEIPSNIDEVKAKDIVRTFERFHKGKNNWHRPAIVSGGAKIHQISIPPDDAQFLQSRDFQAVEIARWFRVPPHRVGIVSKSTSWGSGLAEENMAMLQHTYRPWITRLQDALTMYAPGGQDLGTIIELDTSALLQGTFKEASDIWVGLFEKQVATKNETRQKLGLPKVPDGDKFFEPPAPMGGGDPGGGSANPRTKEEDKVRKQEEAKRNDPLSLLMDDEEDFLEQRINTVHDHGNGQFATKAGMSAATPERVAAFKEHAGRGIPPAWTDVQIADHLETAPLLVVGKDTKGRRQAIYSKEHTARQAEEKFTRVKEMSPHMEKLDASLDRDSLTNDDAGSLALIRHMGMRPGSNSNTGAAVQAHGATNLKKKHVSFDENGGATLDFTGKDGVHIVLHTKDPRVVGVLKSRHSKRANDDDQLFNTNETRVRNYMNGEGGVPKQYKLKDLRTLHANTVAARTIKDIEPPTDKASFKKKRLEVGTIVSQHLGNDPTMALGAYINPTIFTPWIKDGSWL